MRTDEAFKILKNAAWIGSAEEREAVEEAVTMACNALATIEQITWERDIAIDQLQALGYGLGEEPRTDGDLISRKAAIDALWKALYEYEDKTEKQFQESDELDVDDWIIHRIFVQNMNDIDRQSILALPFAQPEETCDTCKHGSFGDRQCDNCRVGYPSHYERRTE